MIRILIPFFYRLGASLQAINNIQAEAELSTLWVSLYTAQQDVSNLLSASWFAPAVRSAYGPGTRLITALNGLTENIDFSTPRKVNFMEAYSVNEARNEFETVLRNELENADTYFVSRKAAYDTSLLISNAEFIFSSDLPTKVTSAIADVREAGKCLAFELSTAAGFHMMRAVESVVRAYWDTVAQGRPHPQERNLGVYIREMENQKLGSEKVRAALKQLKDLHRNPLIHPEESLNLDDAIALFGISQSVVNSMLKEIAATPTLVLPTAVPTIAATLGP